MLGLAAQILRKPSGILPPRARFRAHGHNAAEHVPADENALFPLAAVHAEILDRIDPRAGTGSVKLSILSTHRREKSISVPEQEKMSPSAREKASLAKSVLP